MAFASFSCLNALVELVALCWIEVVRVSILALLVFLEENCLGFSFFTIEYDVSCRLYICWSNFLLFLLCYFERVLNFSNWSHCIYWIDHVVLSFVLLMWYISFIDLLVLNHPSIPGLNLTGYGLQSFKCGVELNLLVFCWGLFISIFIRHTSL